MSDEQEVDLQDEVRAAFVAYDDDGTDSDAGPPRGADGKFVEHETSDEVAAAAKLQPQEPEQPPAEEQPPQILTEDKAPRGWTPAAREKWETIPPDLRQEILRREDASIAGVRQLQERYAPMEQFIQGISPILQEARYYGVDPGGYIDQVMGTERTLRNADIPGKFQAILAIADQYGVPLRDVINQSVGQQVIPPAQQPQYQVPPQIMQELNEMRQWRQQQQNSGVQEQISSFSKDKEFFHDVHSQMAVFIESGQANNLQEAYDAACWSVPAVREVMLARQGLQKKQESAAGASVRPGGGVVVPADENSDELEDVVRNAFIKSSTGRV
jgi:hypothetical protein